MHKREVIPAIKGLLEEVDQVILRLNEKGAQLFKAGKYDQARALLAKAESVSGFRGKVLCLEDNWKALSVPPTKRSSASLAKEERVQISQPLMPGLKTPYDDFRYPILEALIRLGGAGRVREVLSLVEEILSDQLNHYDYQSLPSDPNSVRWKNSASWERYNMVQDGLLAPDSQRGIWEITEVGREALMKAKKSTDLQRKLFSGK